MSTTPKQGLPGKPTKPRSGHVTVHGTATAPYARAIWEPSTSPEGYEIDKYGLFFENIQGVPIPITEVYVGQSITTYDFHDPNPVHGDGNYRLLYVRAYDQQGNTSDSLNLGYYLFPQPVELSYLSSDTEVDLGQRLAFEIKAQEKPHYIHSQEILVNAKRYQLWVRPDGSAESPPTSFEYIVPDDAQGTLTFEVKCQNLSFADAKSNAVELTVFEEPVHYLTIIEPTEGAQLAAGEVIQVSAASLPNFAEFVDVVVEANGVPCEQEADLPETEVEYLDDGTIVYHNFIRIYENNEVELRVRAHDADDVEYLSEPVTIISGSGISPWDINSTYEAKDRVVHKNVKYVAKWWNKGQAPDQNSGPDGPWMVL